MTITTKKLGVWLGAASLVALAACGSSSKTTASSTTAAGASSTTAAAATTTAAGASSTTAAAATTTAASADPLGTPKAASGAPVKIGYYTDGQSAAIDVTEEYLTAQATAKYLNDYQGGIAGHPIDFVLCDGKNDAALSADCGATFVSKGVAAVLFNVAGAPAFAKTVAAANIPIFAFASADATLLGDKTAFVLSNPIQSVAAFPGSVAKKNGFTKAAIIVIDVPGATGPAKAIGIPSLQAVGVAKPDIVNIAPGVADMSPQIQAELKNDPQLVHIIGNASFCTSAVKALRDASYKGTITMISNCVDASTIKTLGAQLKGILVSYAAGEDHNSADFKLFEAILAKYAQGQTITHGGTPMGAFAVWIGFNKAMAAATGDITPASIVSTLQAAPALPLPTIDGATFQCNGKAVTGIPAACTAAFAVATLDENGKPGGFSAG